MLIKKINIDLLDKKLFLYRYVVLFMFLNENKKFKHALCLVY